MITNFFSKDQKRLAEFMQLKHDLHHAARALPSIGYLVKEFAKDIFEVSAEEISYRIELYQARRQAYGRRK